MMYTFDVFDTLITRTTATPVGIFALMQEKLQHDKGYNHIPSYIRENFFYLRRNSEELARHNYQIDHIEDITLEQIYEALAMTGELSEENRKTLIELEKSTELENVVGIQTNIHKVKTLYEHGEKLVLISEMYLDASIIKAMLVKADPVFKELPLYVSSEHKKCKASSALYQIVKNYEKAEYSDWTHCGDNIEKDYHVVKRLGITADKYDFEVLNLCEKKLMEQQEADAYAQLTIGTARNVRLNHQYKDAGAIGSSIAGAILYPYVWWMIDKSRNEGIKRLYFIARDGYVLKRIADIIIRQYQLDIQTYYIYGSRKAWRMPSFSESNDDIYRIVRWSHAYGIKNASMLADVFQIPVQDLLKYLPKGCRNATQRLTQSALYYITKQLDEDDNYKKFLRDYHKSNRAKVIAYLQQEINTDGGNFAFVDLAGGGLTQGCLAQLMSTFCEWPIKTFFFKMDRLKVMNNCINYNFIPSFLHINLVIEMLCRAPHGQTEAYMNDNGRMRPILQENEDQALLTHGFSRYLDGVEEFSKEYARTLCLHEIDCNRIDILLFYMDYMTKNPDKELLHFIADMPNNVTGREEKVITFAPVLTRKQLRQLFFLRTDETDDEIYQGSSIPYSLLRCSKADFKQIAFYQKYYNTKLGKAARYLKNLCTKKHHYKYVSEYPCEILKERIIIYAAGRFGKELYTKLKTFKDIKVVQWVDREYMKYQKEGLPVVSPDIILSEEYDQLVIAVLREEVAESIKKQLIEKGVPQNKILWVKLKIEWN